MSMIGKTLGTFECAALLGKGGMGEVYKAKDQKLGRDVAIKVLPEEFAKDADRVARFQREAKLLASLNHPNIAAIHGLEESDGTHFLVLELIEGDTLADRLKRGAIPVEESLKLALQIAEALEAAHEKGVIHRDLKPANIKVTPHGKVKVLDFGLAKAFAGDQAEVNLSQSPTLSAAATQQGIILGTAAYMSPEQASGEAVDKRADIWAFGVVLFEMLTGRSLFAGDNVSQTLARILERQPDFSALPPSLHPRIRLLLQRCLEKEAKNRYSGISDARVDVEQVLADPSGVFAQPVTAVKPRKILSLKLPWVAAIAVLCLVIAAVAVWYLKPSEPRRIMSFDYHLPEDQQFSQAFMGAHSLAVSPDHSHFAYGTTKGLCIRSLGQLDARLMQGTDGNSLFPFFSPDSQWVGYLSAEDNKIKKIAISGGAPIALCDVSGFAFPMWCTDDTIIYAANDGIMRVSADEGTPETLIEAEDGTTCLSPQMLPDGKSVLLNIWRENTAIIYLQSLESGERTELLEGGSARYLQTGHIVYMLENNLFAVPFDIDIHKVTGGPVSLVEGIGLYDISDSGTLVYLPTSASSEDVAIPQRTLVWVDRKGQEEPLDAPPNAYGHPKISPDGTKVASAISTSAQTYIGIWDLFRKTLSRLTFGDANDSVPLWTPDGQRIVFVSSDEGKKGLYWKAADGTGEVEQLVSLTGGGNFPSSWSGDGNSLVLSELIESSAGALDFDISVISMESDHTRTPLLREDFTEADPQVSPDGRWLAYTSDEFEQAEIYVAPFPDVNSGKWQVSTSGGIEPRWSPDGKQLFYRVLADNAMMVVDIETEPTIRAGIPKELFRGAYYTAYGHYWDIHPDGKRFLMIKLPETTEEESTSAGPRKINIILNWFEELKERVPAP